MARWTYETITSPIPNAKVEKGFADGVHKIYRITPNDGYELHDTERDYTDIQTVVDEETGEETYNEIPMLGYGTDCTCEAAYAFAPVEMQDEAGNTVTAYGDRKFYCKEATA